MEGEIGNGDVVHEAQIDLLRGTEKYHNEKESAVDKQKYGVAWRKDELEASQENPNNPSETLAQDVSSTAVLMKLDDDLVGNIQEVPNRGNWSGRFDFLMSLLGYSVGLGNVWRFPYLAYSNGGGAFVFPFILMLILIGVPLMFLELSFGQFAALGPAAIFDRFCPLFNGLGYGMIVVSGLVSLYYTVIIGWCLLYLFMSFRAELPWERCHEEWRSASCYSLKDATECTSYNGSVYYNQTCFNASEAVRYNLYNLDPNGTAHHVRHAPAQDYFERGVLHISGGLDQLGEVQWMIALCLLLAWTLTFFALSKGVRSTGKVVYFTALFPYVVLFILFFRGVTLPGAVDGIIYYIKPRFDKLLTAKVWSDAAAQIFFALSPAWGGLITLSSYNKFHNDCFKDTLIVGVGNICTSLFAGFVIFAIIGYLASELGMRVDEVVDQGAGLAFIVYPDVVTRLPISPLWSILFFFMMITLGMGSEFALLETVMTAVQDTYPNLRDKKMWVVLCVSILGFFGGLVITTQGGMYILQLMDAFVSSWSVFMMAILECFIVGWVYGAETFLQDIELMIGQKSRLWHDYFKLFWKFITPLTLIVVMLFNLIQTPELRYGEYKYPKWANGIGWVFSFLPLLLILGMSIYKVHTCAAKEMPLRQRLKFLLKHTPEWMAAHKLPKIDLTDDSSKEANKTISNPTFTPV
ncbi:hypothetical protein ScPMuIL_016602 [Solemya velum]